MASAQQHQPPPPDYTNAFFLIISLIADIAAIAALRSEAQDVLLLIGAGVAVALGAAVIIRVGWQPSRWAFYLAISCIIAGMVIGGFGILTTPTTKQTRANGQKDKSGQSSPQPQTPEPSGSPSEQRTSSPIIPTPESEAPEYSGEARIYTGTGVDVDIRGSQAIKGRPAGGPSGGLDLHLNSYGLLYAAGGKGVYNYSGDEPETPEACKRIQNTGQAAGPQIPLSGFQICFVTSERRIAWMSISESSVANFGGGQQYIVGQIKVWK